MTVNMLVTLWLIWTTTLFSIIFENYGRVNHVENIFNVSWACRAIVSVIFFFVLLNIKV